MKLSIFIFVLATIIYGYQCAPFPNWVGFERNMEQLDKTFKALNQQFENSQKYLEEQMKRIEQLPNNGVNGLQNLNGINANAVSGHSTITTSYMINGNHVHKTVIENIIDNVKYRTEIIYTSETGKTETKKYECSLLSNPQCVLKDTEVKDGPPGNFNYNL